MQLTKFKALTFSCAGALFDQDSGVLAALQPLFERGLKLERRELVDDFTQTELEKLQEMPDVPYHRVLKEIHRCLCMKWGIHCSDDDHALFGGSASRWPIFVDTHAALQYFRRYFRMTVLSNLDRESLAIMNRRLEIRFDAVYGSQEIGSHKPDPRNFAFLAKRLGESGLRSEEHLFVGHNTQVDLEPATMCGFATVQIERNREGGSLDLRADRKVGLRPAFQFGSLVDMVKAHQRQLCGR